MAFILFMLFSSSAAHDLGHSLSSTLLTSTFFGYLDDDYKTLVKPRYDDIESYLTQWKREVFLLGEQRVPENIVTSVTSVKRFREHLQKLSDAGVLPESDRRLMEFLDEQSLWLHKHMRRLDTVAAAELPATREFLRDRLRKVSSRVFKYLTEKERLMSTRHVTLHDIEVTTKKHLASLDDRVVTDSKASFDSDRMTDAWKTHSIKAALNSLTTKNNLDRLVYCVVRERYVAFAKPAKAEAGAIPGFLQVFKVRDHLAKLQNPSDKDIALSKKLDSMVSSTDKKTLAAKLNSVRPIIEEYFEMDNLEEPFRELLKNAIASLESSEAN